MAEDTLSVERWTAGESYLEALQKLGLQADCLAWIHHDLREEFMLAIVTTLVDRVGPTEMYELLFQAYEQHGTPKSIDPWIVLVCSPDSVLGQRIMRASEFNLRIGAKFSGSDEVNITVNEPSISLSDSAELDSASYSVKKSWVYFVREPRRQSKHQLEIWNSFRKNVAELAA